MKFAIFNNMDGLGGHYAKLNKLERQILQDITQMWSLKIQQNNEYNKKEARLSGTESKLMATSVGQGQFRGGVGDGEYKYWA